MESVPSSCRDSHGSGRLSTIISSSWPRKLDHEGLATLVGNVSRLPSLVRTVASRRDHHGSPPLARLDRRPSELLVACLLEQRSGVTATARSVIGVVPASAAAASAPVLAALERVFPVRFEGREPTDLAGLDGIVVFADDHIAGFHFAPPDLPCLVFTGAGEGTRGRRSVRVDLSPSDRLGEPLRGRTIEDELVDGSPPLELEPPDEILASSCGRPVWARRPSSEAPLYVCSVPPIDLAAGESLRDYLRPGRFVSLLPLVHLLTEVTKDRQWTPPPLRASLIIDDPNLHWPTYGYVRFAELAHHARAHGYHAAMATIPLDLWYADPRAVRIFRESPAQLSLVVHGNDHTRSELAQPRPLADALDVVSHALERIGSVRAQNGACDRSRDGPSSR